MKHTYKVLKTLQEVKNTVLLQGLFSDLVGVQIQETDLQGFENLAGNKNI